MASLKHIETNITKFEAVKDVVNGGFYVTKSVAEDCEETEEGREIIRELRDVMLEYSHMQREIDQYCEAANKAREEFITSQSKLKLHDLFEKHLKNQTDKNTDAELAENKEVVDFMETIWTQHYGSGGQVEPASSLQSDDEIEMTQVDQTRYICPITKIELVDPVKSKLCGHTYSKQAVETHIKQRKDKAKCPIPGCPHKISIDALEPNNVIAYEMRRRNRNG